MRRTKIAAARLMFAGALGVAGGAAAIVGGTVQSGSTTDAVVFIYNQSGGFECSGALIAPRVVLTAATCLPDATASHYFVLGGVQPLGNALFTIAASEVHVHPAYDSNTFAHDVGVLVLESSPGVVPFPWAATDLGFYETGLPVSVLGYGVANANSQTGDGTRRGAVVSITSHDASTFVTDSSGGQGPCTGDTGGPAMPGQSGDIVIGVVNYGDQNCAQFSVYQRTDANADFIGLFAPEPSEGPLAGAALGALALRRRTTWHRRASR